MVIEEETELGVVVHSCDFSSETTTQEVYKFKASLDYIARPCLENNTNKRNTYLFMYNMLKGYVSG